MNLRIFRYGKTYFSLLATFFVSIASYAGEHQCNSPITASDNHRENIAHLSNSSGSLVALNKPAQKMPRAAKACAITTVSLLSGTVGTFYSQTIMTTGGVPPLNFSVSGSLPPGLSLSNTGTISGIPTTAGTYPFTIEVTNSADCTASQALTITICPEFTFSPSALPSGNTGVFYDQTVSASGGTFPYTYAVTLESLPPGLSLDASTGEISGIPTGVGAFPFTITATDSSGCTGSQAYFITISCGALSFATTTLPQGTQGVPYSATIEIIGGTPPFTFTLTGSLPPGLTLNADGTITGIPSQQGVFSFTVVATDSNGCSSAATTLTITIACGAIEIVTKRLPDGICGIYYDHRIEAVGFTPISFRIKSGRLPPDLDLVPTTGVIQGFPKERGKFRFTVEATSACGSSTEKRFHIETCR